MKVCDLQIENDLKEMRYRWHYETIMQCTPKGEDNHSNVWMAIYRVYNNERFLLLLENEKLSNRK